MNRFHAENDMPILDRPFLIVAEGTADVAFIEALLLQRNIRDVCYLGFPDGKRKGEDGFPDYLIGLRTKIEKVATTVRRILIVTDSDDDPNAKFDKIVAYIRQANAELTADRQYPVPGRVREFVAGDPEVGIATVPFDTPGCLETLLLMAADDGSHALHDCFEAYWPCANFERNSKNVESKQKLTTVIAASNTNNPSCTLAGIWSREQRRWNPMRADHAAFQPLSDFLVAFAA